MIRIKTWLFSFSSFFYVLLIYAPLQTTPAIPTPLLIPKKIIILTHGTFATQEPWYKPGSDFYKALKCAFPDHIIHSYSWSGGPSHQERINDSQKFLNFLLANYLQHTTISIIAHSHGVNVAIAALQESIRLKCPLTIDCFYTLAPPVNANIYNPPMQIINKLHNLFSYGDCVQTVLNLFNRVFPVNKSNQYGIITNTQIKINNNCPSHSELHHPLIATLLPKLTSLLFKKDNCVIHLFTNGLIRVEPDNERERDLISDKKFIETILTSVVDQRSVKIQ